MAFDSWGVLTGREEDEFKLAFRDLGADRGKPFMWTSEPKSEEKIREDLKKIGVTETLDDIAIAKAREAWKKSR